MFERIVHILNLSGVFVFLLSLHKRGTGSTFPFFFRFYIFCPALCISRALHDGRATPRRQAAALRDGFSVWRRRGGLIFLNAAQFYMRPPLHRAVSFSPPVFDTVGFKLLDTEQEQECNGCPKCCFLSPRTSARLSQSCCLEAKQHFVGNVGRKKKTKTESDVV